MSAKFNNIAFLSANFIYTDKSRVESYLISQGWQTQIYDAKLYHDYCQFFYKGFVDFFLGEKPAAHIFTYKVDKEISIDAHKVFIENLTLWLMPYGLALYSIKARQQSDSLNDFTYTLFRMREPRRFDTEEMSEFKDVAINPIALADSNCGNGQLIDNGNKLKVFQIVYGNSCEDFNQDCDNTLFELATLSRIGGTKESDCNSPSQSYVKHTLDSSLLDFYNNWRGLALFDTFTLYGYNIADWVIDNWCEDYFAKIYIHNLFEKFYLFRLNERFRNNPENGEDLENEYDEFEQQYTYPRISYNFLPGEINQAIDKALDISAEKALLSKHISKYNNHRTELSERRVNRLLSFLAIVTVFSTIWDLSCMIGQITPYTSTQTSEVNCYRIAVSSCMLIVGVIIYFLLRKRR